MCCVVLCCVMLYYIILYYSILYYIVLYYIILYYIILYYIILYYIILYYIILYYIILYYYLPNYLRTYLPTHLLNYSMEQSPSWEANLFLTSQEILRIIWNPKVNYNIHKCPPLVPNLYQIDPLHVPTSHFLQIYLNIIFPSTPESSSCYRYLRFPHQNPVYTSSIPHTCYMPRLSHSSRFDDPKNIEWTVQIIKLLIM